MEFLKRTYTLPAKTLHEFEEIVAPGQRSSTIDFLPREWLDEMRREHFRQQIIEGCRVMSEIYLEIEREYHGAPIMTPITQ